MDGFRFGDFELDAAGELRRGGECVPLQEQPRRLLLELVGSAGCVVPRERLRSALWPDGIHVAFERGLNSAVRRLREALHDTGRPPRYVETVARRGYRFVAEVRRIPAGGGSARSATATLWGPPSASGALPSPALNRTTTKPRG